MDFSFSEEQQHYYDTVVKFATKELNNNVLERDHTEEFDWQGWKKCAEFGLLGLPVEEEYGGQNADIITCVLAMQGLGFACEDAGLLFALNSHVWTCSIPMMQFGTDEQKANYLPQLSDGTMIGGHAMTEPDSGSDAYALTTTAVREGDSYILNGSKIFTSNAPIADVLLIFALTDKDKGFAGLSVFIVETSQPGITVSKPLDKTGLRTSPTGEVFLENCKVSEANRLGPEGAGSAIFNAEMEWERSCLFASHLGSMERQLDECVRYAKDRRQFGKSIGEFQAISGKIADMKVRIELAQLMLYKVAWMKANGKRAHLESAIAKLFTSESYVQSSLDAVQIHGGYGCMREFGVERNLRDSLASRIYSGTSEIQRNTIASWLGL